MSHHPASPLPLRVAFIRAGWHAEIVGQALRGFLDELAALGHAGAVVDVFDVPGAYEIPLHAQLLAKSGNYAGVVGAALVVDGGIYRHEFVSQTVVQALMQVQLATEIPVFSVVLTPHHFHGHDEQHAFFHSHFVTKGAEAARALVATVNSLARLRKPAGDAQGAGLRLAQAAG